MDASATVRINGIDYPCHPKVSELFKTFHRNQLINADLRQKLEDEINRLKTRKIIIGSGKVGKGVIANVNIKKDEMICVNSILELPISEIQNTKLWDYVFDHDDENYVIVLGEISMTNHDYDPNAFVSFENNEATLCALKDIEKGQEIFINYGEEYWQTANIEAI